MSPGWLLSESIPDTLSVSIQEGTLGAFYQEIFIPAQYIYTIVIFQAILWCYISCKYFRRIICGLLMNGK